MTEEPKQAVGSAQGKAQTDGRREAVRGVFRENPTLFLSLMYIDLTGIGILYSLIFYGQFGINIFDFAEIGDFLLAAFKAPAVTFFALLAQVLLVLLVTLALSPLLARMRPLLREGQRVLPKLVSAALSVLIVTLTFGMLGEAIAALADADKPLTQRERRHGRVLGSLIVAIVLLGAVGLIIATAIIPLQLARSQADAIKQGGQPHVTVQHRTFSSSAEQVTQSGLYLLGATQKVVFLYDENPERTLVIPQAQIVSIEVPEFGKVS